MRKQIELGAPWRFQPDPYEEGEAVGWFRPDYERRFWREVAVPCSFDRTAPGMDTYEGVCWYVREVDVPAEWAGQRIALRFEAVNYKARVWINGELAGENLDGFLPFEIDATDLLRPGGRNVIAVRVDNYCRDGEVPGKQHGWRNFGGILREVRLIATSRVHIADAYVTAEPDGTFALAVALANRTAESVEALVSVRILDGDGNVCASLEAAPVSIGAGGQSEVNVSATVAKALAWTPDEPCLYTAEIALHVGADRCDERTLRFGFRRIETRDGEILLNGERIYLTGFNRHDDSPATDLCTDLATTRRDLEDMKKLGCNFVRLCHYPHHPGELDLCDELGLLAMCEIPLYWWGGLEEGEQNCAKKLAGAKRQVETLIRRDRSHPSVVFWSVSNENKEDKDEVAAGNRELLALARRLDPTRLAVHVSHIWQTHPNFAEDDVCCVNMYPTWGGRGKDPHYDMADATRWWQQKLATLHAQFPGKPILVTEFGHPSLEGVTAVHMGEDVQASSIEAQFAGMTAPYVRGATIWCYADHPWPPGAHTRGLAISPFGVVSRQRRPLAARGVVRRIFRERQGIPTPAAGPPKREAGGLSVNMIRPDLKNIPRVDFPEGFSIRPMRIDEGPIWVDIHRDAEHYFSITDDLFAQQFGFDPQSVQRRCFFVVAANGSAVGTISAWHYREFRGKEYGRIHWVAIREAYQGKGLGKAALSFALGRLAKWHERVFLDTSSDRIPAIGMYLNSGFLPDLEPAGAVEAWREVKAKLDHPALRDV